MKNLQEVLDFLGVKNVDSSLASLSIQKLTMHSKLAGPGTVFCALQGTQKDGHDFIEEALQQGCSAVLCEKPFQKNEKSNAVFVIPNLKNQLGKLANFCFPLKPDLKLIAVTGTNGKTSVTHFVSEGLSLLGIETGLIGSLTHTLTTPNRLEFAELLPNLPATVAIEASSHALDQGRLLDLPIEVAVFTNVSHDHLDYHLTLENYQKTKAKLFAWPTLKAAILNQDDPVFEMFKTQLPKGTRCLTYSLSDPTADIHVLSREISPKEQKTSLRIHTPQGELFTEWFLLGDFNLANMLATLGVFLHFGFSPHEVRNIFPQLHPPKGRMERILLKNGALAVIDYAHTPDAMEKVLKTLKPYANRLFCVFGCGGDRDRLKRPKMAEIAEKYSSRVFVTEDNARFEDEAQIFNDIKAGFKHHHYEIIPSRKDAILKAMKLSKSGDVILLAGKGHETYLDKKGIKKSFDERVILKEEVL